MKVVECKKQKRPQPIAYIFILLTIRNCPSKALNNITIINQNWLLQML